MPGAVPWASNLGLDGELSLIPQIISVELEQVAQSASITGNLESRGRRKPDNCYGFRLPGWSWYYVNAKRVGSVSPWEDEAERRYNEYFLGETVGFREAEGVIKVIKVP